jgi:aspartate-semialdehyde dehydrogenase
MGYRVAIVGATGAVGQEMRKVLEERAFPVESLKLLASVRSKGKRLPFKGEKIKVEVLQESSFRQVDIALFSAGASISREFAPQAVKAGTLVIDNSSAFRLEKEVPLVVPEVNSHALNNHQGLIANPNCSTIQLVVVLYPLHQKATLKRVVVTTFQSVSGTGKRAIEELKEQSQTYLAGKEDVEPVVYPHPIAFNVLPHIDVFFDNAYTKEEIKMVLETRKIMGLPQLALTATCVRVPVFISHSESVNIETEKSISPEEARQILENAPGVKVLDQPDKNLYPTPRHAAHTDPCFVGRIRKDDSIANGLNLWVVADNLRKGAALNAVQIAEEIVKKGFI